MDAAAVAERVHSDRLDSDDFDILDFDRPDLDALGSGALVGLHLDYSVGLHLDQHVGKLDFGSIELADVGNHLDHLDFDNDIVVVDDLGSTLVAYSDVVVAKTNKNMNHFKFAQYFLP